jgi:hypothetical protein
VPLATLDVAAGTYEVIGKATIDLSSGTRDTVECQLGDTTGNAFDTSSVTVSTDIDLAQLSLTAFDKTTAGGTLTMICDDYTSGALASNIDFVATRLSSATGDIPGS